MPDEYNSFPIPFIPIEDTNEAQKASIREGLGINPTNLGVSSNDLTDATATGRSAITAENAEALRIAAASLAATEKSKLIPLDVTLDNIVANTVSAVGPLLAETTDGVIVFLPSGSTAGTGNNANWEVVNDNQAVQTAIAAETAARTAELLLKANVDLSNVNNGSVTQQLLDANLLASIQGSFPPEDFLGNVESLADNLVDPAANSGKYYFVSGVSGTMTGTNPPTTPVQDGGYILSNGTNWLSQAARPVVLLNGSVTFLNLEPGVRDLVGENLTGYDFIRVIQDTNGYIISAVRESNGAVFIQKLETGVINETANIPGYLRIVTDSLNRVIAYILESDGSFYIQKLASPVLDAITDRLDALETGSTGIIDTTVNIPGYLRLVVDSNNKVLGYILESDGTHYIHKLASPTLDAITDRLDVVEAGQVNTTALQLTANKNEQSVEELQKQDTGLKLLDAFVDSDNSIKVVNDDDSETEILAAEVATEENQRKELAGHKTSITFTENKRRHRVGKNGKGKRRVYKPADINHIISHGQSNSVGYNGSQGNPISTTQPFDNVQFGPLTYRHYRNDGDPATQTDDSVLTFDTISATGLRAPWDLSARRATIGGTPNTPWGPAGKDCSVYNFEHYRTQLASIDFVPLVAAFDPVGGATHSECMINSICNELSAKTGERFLGSVAGIGSMPIFKLSALNKGIGSSPDDETNEFANTVDLSTFDPSLDGWWGTGSFANVLAQVERAKQICDSKGLSYKVAAVSWVQGETNTQDDNYAAQLSALAEAYNVCIKAMTGQVEDVVVFTDLIEYNEGTYATNMQVDQEYLIAHLNSEPGIADNKGRIYISGPRYQYDTPVHYDAQSFLSKGTVYAEAIYQAVFKSEEWDPVRYKSHVIDGNDIYVKFFVPKAPLQFDVPNANSVSRPVTGANANNGFEVLNSSSSPILTSVELVSPDMVKLTCSETPSGGTLRYAWQEGSANTIRGNLCDSFSVETVFKDGSSNSYETRNWAIAFSQSI